MAENEPEEKLLGRFRRAVFKAGVIQECKRRRFFESSQDKKKRKAREASKRNRKRFVGFPSFYLFSLPFFHCFGATNRDRFRVCCLRFDVIILSNFEALNWDHDLLFLSNMLSVAAKFWTDFFFGLISSCH